MEPPNLHSFQPQELLEPLLVICGFHKNAFQGAEKHLRTLIKPSTMGNGTFMFRDFGFLFSFLFLSIVGKEARTKQGFQLSSLTRNLFFQYFFFFLNESGLLSRASQSGTWPLTLMELDSVLTTTQYTSLQFVTRHVQLSVACFPFPFPLLRGARRCYSKMMSLQCQYALANRQLVKMQNPRAPPQKGALEFTCLTSDSSACRWYMAHPLRNAGKAWPGSPPDLLCYVYGFRVLSESSRHLSFLIYKTSIMCVWLPTALYLMKTC